jgi:hypothetical protein
VPRNQLGGRFILAFDQQSGANLLQCRRIPAAGRGERVDSLR